MLEPEEANQAQARLLSRVAAGDREALAEFYDQTATPLFSVALRMVGEPGEAEEIIQDVFVQIWRKAGTFDAALGTAFHWALSITRHRSIDRVRARIRQTRLLDELTSQASAEPPRQSGPDNSASGAEESVAVRHALESLPAEQRQAIELAFFAGKSHFEIAELLKEPLGTVKARIRRGMLRLRELLQEHA